MGDTNKDDPRVGFDSRLKPRFCGSKVTVDAGLRAYRELDEAFELTEMGADLLTGSRYPGVAPSTPKLHEIVDCPGLDGAYNLADGRKVF